MSRFHSFSSAFQIITSCSALGVKELMLQFCGLLIYFMSSSLLVPEEKNELQHPENFIFLFLFSIWKENKTDWVPRDCFFISLAILPTALEQGLQFWKLFLILYDLFISVPIILYYIVLSHISLLYLVN